jgi:hypothetical protein
MERLIAEVRARRGLIVAGLSDLPGVACLAGTALGRYGGGHLRLSCANSRENISRALERMGEVLAGSAKKGGIGDSG